VTVLTSPQALRPTPTFLSNGTRYSFPGGKGVHIVKLATHLSIVLRLRMNGALPPLLVCIQGMELRHRNLCNFTVTNISTVSRVAQSV
jgi:hypothetical protein